MCFEDFQLDFPDPALAHTCSYCQPLSCLACPPSVAKLSDVPVRPSLHSTVGFHVPSWTSQDSSEALSPST